MRSLSCDMSIRSGGVEEFEELLEKGEGSRGMSSGVWPRQVGGVISWIGVVWLREVDG